MPHVLVVDADAEVSDLVREVLAAAGHDVSLCYDIAGARQILAEGRVGLLIASAQLPDGPGTALADLATGRGVPALMITGHQSWLEQFEAEQRPFLQKPFGMRQLLAAVDRYLS